MANFQVTIYFNNEGDLTQSLVLDVIADDEDEAIELAEEELQDYIHRNDLNMNKATGAFFGQRHELYKLLSSATKHTVTALLTDKANDDDETLMTAIKNAKESLLSPIGVKVHPGSGPYCTGNRMNMLATELTEKEEK
jgi:hypothetical protein